MRLPGTKRTARAPDGRRWRVGRRWTPATRPELRSSRRDEADGWQSTDVGKRSGEDGGGGDGGGWGIGDIMDGDAFAVGIVLVLVVGVLFFFLLPVVEAILLVVLLVGGVASRVVLRRPWRVEARLLDGDRPRAREHWEVVGWRRSGAVAREVSEHLTRTGELPADRPRGALPPRTG